MQQRHSSEKPRAVGPVITSPGSRRGSYAKAGTKEEQEDASYIYHLEFSDATFVPYSPTLLKKERGGK